MAKRIHRGTYRKINALTPKQKAVYDALRTFGVTGIRPHDLAIFMGFKESAYVAAQLKALLTKGLATKIEGLKGKRTRYKTIA